MTRSTSILCALLCSASLLGPSTASADRDSWSSGDELSYGEGAEWVGYGTTAERCSRVDRLAIVPCDQEESDWIARPFVADLNWEIIGAQYVLFDGAFPNPQWRATCDASLAHRVQILVGTDPSAVGAPESNPVVAAEWVIPSRTRSPGRHTIKLKVEEPIQLRRGEYAFLSVQYAGDVEDGAVCSPTSGKSLCVSSCVRDAPSFWSFSDSPAYSWTDLRNVGIQDHPEAGLLVRKSWFAEEDPKAPSK